jgi:Mg-chelatase subunit ChlD
MTVRARKLWIAPLFVGVFGVGGWLGCSASGEDGTTSGFDDQGSTGTGNSPASGGAGGQGGAGQGGEGGGLDLTGGASSGQGGGENCVEENVAAEQVQLDIVVLQDRSGSMSGTKWDGTVAALQTFVNDPASAGINIGIVYFPANDGSNDCVLSDYSNVLAYGQLPGNAAAFTQSLDTTSPGGGTPLYGGMFGALQAATLMQTAEPDHKVIVVLGSDGDPTSCSVTSIPEIAGLAQKAYNYNGVQTYVIAIDGSTISSLNQIAAAGGTMQAYDITGNISAFSQKMAEIRAAALGCEVPIPDPPDNETLDPDFVNVNYTPGGVGMAQKLPKKDSKADCGAGGGWYYDDPDEPTKILFCPTTCDTIQADQAAKVQVGFGCKSIAD